MCCDGDGDGDGDGAIPRTSGDGGCDDTMVVGEVGIIASTAVVMTMVMLLVAMVLAVVVMVMAGMLSAK